MKKVLAGILAASMCLMMAACSSSSSKAPETKAPETSAPETSAPETEAPETSAPETEAAADTGYPEGPITVVVPYGAGGGTDLFARVVVDEMSKILGKPVEVTNLTGGAGTIGATDVAEANPDGYKLYFGITTPLAIMPLYGETSYSVEDFQPICTAYSTVQAIVVANDSEIQDIQGLLDYIKENNNTVSYGGSGIGNLQHLNMEEWFAQVGDDSWNMTNVPYTDGDAAEAVALMSGEVPFAVAQSHGIKSYVEDGSLRVLMVFSDRLPQWMVDDGLDVPLVTDLGYKYSLAGVIGFCAPAGVPEEVVTKIDNAFAQAIQNEEVLAKIANLGLEVDYRQVDEYNKILAEQAPVAEQLLKDLGLIE